MAKDKKEKYLKRTQRDYSYAFKLQVVAEIERGELSRVEALKKYGIQSGSTIRTWIRKFGNLDSSYEQKQKKMKSPEQKLLELEQKIKLLERKNKSLERQIEQTDKKAIFFDMMIDIAEEEFKIPIRKKYLSDQLKDTETQKKKN